MNASVASATLNIPDAGNAISGTIAGAASMDPAFDALLSALAQLPEASANSADVLPQSMDSAVSALDSVQSPESGLTPVGAPWLTQLATSNDVPEIAHPHKSDAGDSDGLASLTAILADLNTAPAIIPNNTGSAAEPPATQPRGQIEPTHDQAETKWTSIGPLPPLPAPSNAPITKSQAAEGNEKEAEEVKAGEQPKASTRPELIIDAPDYSSEGGDAQNTAAESTNTAEVAPKPAQLESLASEDLVRPSKPRDKGTEHPSDENQVRQTAEAARLYSTIDFISDRAPASPIPVQQPSHNWPETQDGSPPEFDMPVKSRPQSPAAGARPTATDSEGSPSSTSDQQADTMAGQAPKLTPSITGTAPSKDTNAKPGAHGANDESLPATSGGATTGNPAAPPSHVAADVPAAASPHPAMPVSHDADAPVRISFTVPHIADSPSFEALAVKIAARSNTGEQNFSIRLDPPELGRVEVNLNVNSEGRAHAELSADKPQTLELLQKDAPALERALKDAGLNLSGGLAFSLKGDGKSGAWRDAQGGSRGRNLQIAGADAATANASMAGNAALAARAYGLPTLRLDIRV